VEVAGEADLLPHLVEILGDARDFLEAELMDLVGCVGQCRRRLDIVAVERVAALHVHQPDAVARMAEIVVGEEITHALQCRIDDGLQRRPVLLRDPRAVGGAERCRERPDRTPVR